MSNVYKENQMQVLNGSVKKIIYQNEDNGYSVLIISEKNGKESTAVGIMPSITQFETIQAYGKWVTNEKFGRQFKVESYIIKKPTTSAAILGLLSSGLIEDIGPKRAELIVNKFGSETIDVLNKNPEKIKTVPGIGKKISKKIISSWNKRKSVSDLMLFLQGFGISTGFVNKLYKIYGDDAKKVISANPYRLIEDVWGVGFKKADLVARKVGIAHNSYRRIKAGIIHTLKKAAGEGHLFLPLEILEEKATKLLGVNKAELLFSFDHLRNENIIVNENRDIYLKGFFDVENRVAGLIAEKIKFNTSVSIEAKIIDSWIEEYSQQSGWHGAKKQIEAIKSAAKKSIFVLTGGPGTGKTTTLNVMVKYFKANKLKVQLSAPTGRAAQRMGQISGLKAKTVHRLLEYTPHGTDDKFNKNTQNKLKTDVLICDEVSMVDIFLMENILSATKNETLVIFVGDSNQLPSVGPGNVLHDMIESGVVPHVELDTVYRQAAASKIVTTAHAIINGKIPKIENKKEDNCFFIHEDDPELTLKTIADLVTTRLPTKYGFNPFTEIQVLSPMHKGVIGTISINKTLQKELNGKNKAIKKRNRYFAQNDKVMQIKNDYENDVYNGDIGFIESVNSKELSVNFSGKVVIYGNEAIENLVHAYCISIHKSQGSEFKAVIIPVTTSHFVMLQRNLIYTALTRARELAILIGTDKAFGMAISNNSTGERNTKLSARIKKLTRC